MQDERLACGVRMLGLYLSSECGLRILQGRRIGE